MGKAAKVPSIKTDFSDAPIIPPRVYTQGNRNPEYEYVRRIIRPQVVKEFESFLNSDLDLSKALTYEAWFVDAAGKFKVPEFWVREFVGDYLDHVEAYTQVTLQGHAKKAATLVGATMTRAMQTFAEGMSADKEVAYATRDEEGNQTMEFKTIPDWTARLTAAREVTRVWGGYAAEKHEHEHTHTHEFDELTDEQVKSALERTLLKIHQESRRRTDQVEARSLEAAGRADGAVVDVRSILLDDDGDQDQG